jgi:hypothetical protein
LASLGFFLPGAFAFSLPCLQREKAPLPLKAALSSRQVPFVSLSLSLERLYRVLLYGGCSKVEKLHTRVEKPGARVEAFVLESPQSARGLRKRPYHPCFLSFAGIVRPYRCRGCGQRYSVALEPSKSASFVRGARLRRNPPSSLRGGTFSRSASATDFRDEPCAC